MEKKIKCLSKLFYFSYLQFYKFFIKIFFFLKKHIVLHSSVGTRDYDNVLDRLNPQIVLEKDEINLGVEELKKFGLSKNDKFVCFMVRDAKYLNSIFPKTDWSYWNYRNYDIDKFVLAAEELTKLGYYVFRMGKITDKKFDTNNKMIIDYSKSSLKSDFLDIYLGANCEFCLTTDVGYDIIPYIFRRPLASISDPISLIKFSSKKFLTIFSQYYSVKEKRNLSLEEIFKKNMAYFFITKDIDSSGIKLIQPDQNQIRDLALDMVNHINNNFSLTEEQEAMQNSFFNIYIKNINSKNFIDDYKIKMPEEDDYKLHSKYYGRISPSFLKKIDTQFIIEI